jgi:hypothetical protein
MNSIFATPILKTKFKDKTIARSREQLASYVSMSKKVADRLLKQLKQQGLIKIRTGLFFNRKRFFISSKENLKASVNAKKMNILTKHTKDNRASLLVAHIAYKIQSYTDIIKKDEKLYTRCTREELKKLLHTTNGRAVDILLSNLETQKIAQKEGRYLSGKCYYLSIDDRFYNTFCSEYEQAQTQAMEAQILNKQDKTSTSYNNRYVRDINIKNNNTNTRSSYARDTEKTKTTTEQTNVNGSCVTINLSTGEHKMSNADWAYLLAALNRTVLAQKNTIDVQRLNSELRYALSTAAHTQRMTSFKHCVNSFMYLIRTGTWKQPLEIGRTHV